MNSFKTQIEEVVQNNTARKLTIEGNVDLSIFPWLGITTGKITLSNHDGFAAEPFAQISESQIKVKLVPLLFKQVEVSEIVLKGLKLNLLKNPQGLSNWDDLVAMIQNKESSKSPLKLLQIASISLKNAQINWNNQQTAKSIEIKDFNLNTNKVVFNQPINLIFGFTAYDAKLAITETISFKGDLRVSEELDMFRLKQFRLQSQTLGDFLPTGKLAATLLGAVNFDLKQQTLKFSPIQVKTDVLTISASNLTAWLEKSFKLEGLVHIPDFSGIEFLQHYTNVKLPVMVDETALTWLAADFYLDLDANHARLKNLEIQMDETTIKGGAYINNFSSPAINVNFALDKINFDRYLPPAQTANNLQDLNVLKAAAENTSLFPLETLKSLNLNGELSIHDLKVKNLTMQGVKLFFNAKNGFVQSLQSVNRFYQGAYSGRLIFDASSDLPILSISQQLSHIQLNSLLADLNGQSALAGLVDVSSKLEASGNTHAALKSSLNGRLSVVGKDILIRGFSLQKIVNNGKILLGSSTLPTGNTEDQTTFPKVTGTAIVSNGFLSNNDLSATAAKAKVAGMGWINLLSEQFDYRVVAVLDHRPLFNHPKTFNNLPVFINIGGSFNEPTYQVDLAAMGMGL
jgi:AsmA protein